MKKICIVNPTILMKRPVSEIINNIKGYEIGLLCPRKVGKKLDKSLHHSELIKKAKIFTYPTFQLPFVASEWPIPLPSFFFKVFKIYKEYDTVHMWVYFYLSSFWITFVKLFFPKKKMILTMDTVPAESFSMGKLMDFCFKMYHKLFGWFVFGVPNIITLYGESLIPFARRAGIKRKKMIVIPTGIDIHKFDRHYKNLRDELGIKKDEKIGLFIGLMVKRKGIDIIIKTMDKLREEQFKMVLVGDGPEKKKYEKMIKEYGLQDKIIFTGIRKDIKDLCRSSDLLFFPSRGEGLAGVIMEAMSAGLPIVSSRIPCTTDLVKEGENGYLCEIEDVDCYAAHLKKLIRVRSGIFTLDDAIALDHVPEVFENDCLGEYIYSMNDVLVDLPYVSVMDQYRFHVLNGNPIPEAWLKREISSEPCSQYMRILDGSGSLVALGKLVQELEQSHLNGSKWIKISKVLV